MILKIIFGLVYLLLIEVMLGSFLFLRYFNDVLLLVEICVNLLVKFKFIVVVVEFLLLMIVVVFVKFVIVL